MKHFDLFESALQNTMTYTGYIDAAVRTLNTSIGANRNNADSSHAEEREVIVSYIANKFGKSEEEIVVDIITHNDISAVAINDYMYQHHRNFPSDKASILPDNLPLVRDLGFHVAALIKGALVKGISAKITPNQLKPAMVFSYFNKRIQDWVSFRVTDTDVYKITQAFKDACINNGLLLIDGRGKIDEFTPLVEYIKKYVEINIDKIDLKEQYDHIGWNKEKTIYISPRDKSKNIIINNEEYQKDVDLGYISKGNDPAKNVNDMLAVLKDFPLALAIYASPFVNPIIDGAVLDANCITIDLYGPQGKGENLLQYVALNPMGILVNTPNLHL